MSTGLGLSGLVDRIRGCVVGAAIGDALGMPLEFGPPQPSTALVREMRSGRIPAGAFTDDTEMALALSESLLAHRPLDPVDLAHRFVDWFRAGPPDVGIHTASVLQRIAGGEFWEDAVQAVQATHPQSAGNGSVMRCWPVALAYWNDKVALLETSRLQSRVTHPHIECQAGSAVTNMVIAYLFQGMEPDQAIKAAIVDADLPSPLQSVIETAPLQVRDDLPNTGWVRHTLQSAVWGLLTTDSFEDAVVNVVNLGHDADTAGAVVGALAGAAYGLSGIPRRWQSKVWGEWPLGSGQRWELNDLLSLADRLSGI